MSEAVAQPLSRHAIVEQLFELFRHGGFEGVSIRGISAATGLGKSSLYYHFPGGKTEMASAVLEQAGAWFHSEVAAALHEDGASRHKRVDGMLSALDQLYCSGSKPCILASMLLGGADGDLGTAVTGAFKQWRDSLEFALTETGMGHAEAAQRAIPAIIQIEGSLILSRALNDTAIFHCAVGRTRTMLLE